MRRVWAVIAPIFAAALLTGCGPRAAPTVSFPSLNSPGPSATSTARPTPASRPVTLSSNPAPPAPALRRGRPAAVTVTNPMLSTMHLNSAAFPTARTAFVSGAYVQGHAMVGFVAATGDGGHTWHRIATMPGTLLTDLTFQNARRGWAVGAKLPNHASENADEWVPIIPHRTADVLWQTVNETLPAIGAF